MFLLFQHFDFVHLLNNVFRLVFFLYKRTITWQQCLMVCTCNLKVMSTIGKAQFIGRCRCHVVLLTGYIRASGGFPGWLGKQIFLALVKTPYHFFIL